MPCEAGFTGMMTRFCNADGVWETPDRSLCGRVAWEAVYEGDSFVKSCAPGFDGSISRLCALGGSWTEPVNNCSRSEGRD